MPPPPSALISAVISNTNSCRHNKAHGITPSVATAASVGDSILDSINGDGANNANREGGRDVNADRDGHHVASWAEHALPPDQVSGAPSLLLAATAFLVV